MDVEDALIADLASEVAWSPPLPPLSDMQDRGPSSPTLMDAELCDEMLVRRKAQRARSKEEGTLRGCHGWQSRAPMLPHTPREKGSEMEVNTFKETPETPAERELSEGSDWSEEPPRRQDEYGRYSDQSDLEFEDEATKEEYIQNVAMRNGRCADQSDLELGDGRQSAAGDPSKLSEMDGTGAEAKGSPRAVGSMRIPTHGEEFRLAMPQPN